MKPPAFAYVRATSVADALAHLSGDQEVKLLAGGQSLLPLMNFRFAAPDLLVDIDGLWELDRVLPVGDDLLIGALTRHDRLARDERVASGAPLLTAAARHIGHVAIRNRGTIGGSLAHADPTAELPAVMIALHARIICDRADGRRRELDAADFFQGRYETALEPDEMITWIRVTQPAPVAGVRGWGFHEVAPREGDFAWAGACTIRESAEQLRVVVFGVEPRPRVFATTVERFEQDRSLVRTWVDGLQATDEPDLRRDLAAEMIRRATSDALNGRRS